jgi:hypothetical protein
MMTEVGMRTTIVPWFVIVCSLASPAAATPKPDQQVQQDAAAKPHRRPISSEELGRYEERERSAQKQKQFEGGRMRNSDLITIILVLVVVILVLAII